ncbi:hypothetical protein ACFSTC_60100 [Nonomuraea ferruginea]
MEESCRPPPAQLPYDQPGPLRPPPLLRRLQASGPIHAIRTAVGDPGWQVTGYEEVRALLDDPPTGPCPPRARTRLPHRRIRAVRRPPRRLRHRAGRPPQDALAAAAALLAQADARTARPSRDAHHPAARRAGRRRAARRPARRAGAAAADHGHL